MVKVRHRQGDVFASEGKNLEHVFSHLSLVVKTLKPKTPEQRFACFCPFLLHLILANTFHITADLFSEYTNISDEFFAERTH